MEVLGQRLTATANWACLKGRVGLVFQSPDDQMVATTVEREIAFGLENLGLLSAEIRSRVDEMLQRFQLQAYARRSPHLLSGGEKQRLALASVLVMQPEILILDEVTSLLDPVDRRAVCRLLQELKSRCTLFLITQFSPEALLADRILLLHEGRLLRDAAPPELFSRVQAEEIFSIEIPLIYRLLAAAQKRDF